MKMPLVTGAICRGCGYALRGLSEAVCPECGRAFDPDDSSTFLLERDLRRRRRRRMMWVGVVVAVLAVLGVLAPRGIMTSTVTLTCPDCQVAYRTARYELRPPGWMRADYPAIYLPLVAPEEEPHEDCPKHRYDVSVSLQSRGVIQANGRATADPGEECDVLQIPALPENGRKMIEAMLQRNGVSVWCAPPPAQP